MSAYFTQFPSNQHPERSHWAERPQRSCREHSVQVAATGGRGIHVAGSNWPKLWVMKLGLSILGAIARLVPACAPVPQRIGDRGVVAYYAWGEVTTNLPPPYDQKTTSVAAEDALRAKGYVIVGRTSLDADPCRIYASPGRATRNEETVVTIHSAGGGTRIAIYVRPTGDAGEGGAVLSAILSRLGLMSKDETPPRDAIGEAMLR
jgi:hypothetical protein